LKFDSCKTAVLNGIENLLEKDRQTEEKKKQLVIEIHFFLLVTAMHCGHFLRL